MNKIAVILLCLVLAGCRKEESGLFIPDRKEIIKEVYKQGNMANTGFMLHREEQVFEAQDITPFRLSEAAFNDLSVTLSPPDHKEWISEENGYKTCYAGSVSMNSKELLIWCRYDLSDVLEDIYLTDKQKNTFRIGHLGMETTYFPILYHNMLLICGPIEHKEESVVIEGAPMHKVLRYRYEAVSVSDEGALFSKPSVAADSLLQLYLKGELLKANL